MIKKQKGITLIALIITIILLIILASVAIAEISGDGIISKAEQQKNQFNEVETQFNVVANEIVGDIKNKLNPDENKGESDTSEHEHNWGDWVTTKAATCTTAGSKKRTCSKCNATETQTIEALGHILTPNGNYEDYNATYHIKYNTCSRCGLTNIQEGLEEHSWEDWEITTAATCTKTGTQTRTCSKCGREEKQEISKASHTMKITGYTLLTCTTNQTETYSCVNCNYTETDTIQYATGHSYGSWVTTKAATCTTSGKKTRTCINDTNEWNNETMDYVKCGYPETVTIAALGHNYNNTGIHQNKSDFMNDEKWDELMRDCKDCSHRHIYVRSCLRSGCSSKKYEILAHYPKTSGAYEYSGITDVSVQCVCGDTFLLSRTYYFDNYSNWDTTSWQSMDRTNASKKAWDDYWDARCSGTITTSDSGSDDPEPGIS